MSNMSKIDSLIRAAVLGGIGRGMEIYPIAVKIVISPTGVCGKMEVNKQIIEDFQADEWLKETDEKFSPIIREQTEKFVELFKKKFDVNLKEATDESDSISDMIDKALKDIFGVKSE